MSEPVPFVSACPCGARATHGVMVHVDLGGGVEATPVFHACKAHVPPLGSFPVTSTIGVLPTHHPCEMDLVSSYPPKKGEMMVLPDKAIGLGCPGCGRLATLASNVFKLDGRQLKPSFICPVCHLHAWLKTSLDGDEPTLGVSK